jgi:hypothetical protein
MSKVVTIPKDRNPFVVIVNGVKHEYPAGVTTEVPDEVADVIEKYVGAKPKPDPNAGGGVSWNDLKDKPFWEEVATGVVIESQSVEIGEEGYAELYGVKNKILVGKSYTVTFDGTTYECVAWFLEEYNAFAIGNGSFVGADGLGDDVPFEINYYSDGSTAWLNTSEGMHSIEVCGEVLKIQTIDAKYIPDGTGGEKTWLLYSPEDDDVNFVIAEIDSAYSDNPVYIEWDTLKAMNSNEIMRRLVGNYGEDACAGVHRDYDGEGEFQGFIVCIHHMSEWSGKIHTQDKYYNITADGIEFYGMTDSEEIALEGGTLSDGK